MDDIRHSDPESYNQLISEHHLYVHEADLTMTALVSQLRFPNKINQVVELGCGPGRLLPLIIEIENIELTAIDHNERYVNYAAQKFPSLAENLLKADIETYQHSQPVHIFYSMGVHHLMRKNPEQCQYLQRIYQQLLPGGYYILGDEFVPNYSSEQEREIKLVIWYAHIISHALKEQHQDLAFGETRVLLDDILKQRHGDDKHSAEQIDMVLNDVKAIAEAANYRNLDIAKTLAQSLIDRLDTFYSNTIPKTEPLNSFSDYKICDRELREQITKVGFELKDITSIGPDAPIGSLSVYTLRKPA